MRALPQCNEGFRRLALVAALLAVLVGIGYGVNEDLCNQNQVIDLCFSINKVEHDNCQYSPGEEAACKAKADAEEPTCLKRATLVNRESFEMLAFFSGIGIVGAYVAALIVRTLGWVSTGVSCLIYGVLPCKRWEERNRPHASITG